MIIDSHVHFGNSTWGNFTPEVLLEVISDVDIAICSNLEGIEGPSFQDEYTCNMKMLEIARKYPKLKPLIVCQPNISGDEGVIRSLLNDYPEFVGLKFHPECMKLPADSDKYNKYLELAREFNKPCLYHSGHTKSKYSSPYLIYKKAQEFPEVSFILGHLSTGPKNAHVEAVNIILESISKDNAKIYTDTSWIDFAYEELNETYEDTLMLIEKLKFSKWGDYSNRILWATDAMVGKFNHSRASYKKNLTIFKQKVLERFSDQSLLDDLVENNAKKLYGI